MPIITKTAVKNFNGDLLSEQVAALLTVAVFSGQVKWAGFHRLTDRVYEPNAGVQEIGRHSANGQTTIDTAQPGELRFTCSRDLTSQEDTDLDAILTAHNSANLTAEQTRQDQDEADLESLIETERDTFIANLSTQQTTINGWDAATTAQKLVAAKASFTAIRQNQAILGKVLRLFLRSRQGGLDI